MLVLDSTTRSLVALLGGAVATNELPIIGSYVDISQTTFAVTASSAFQAQSNGSTEVVLMAAPGAATSRKLDFLLIRNADTAAVTLRVRYKDGATTRDYAFTLAVGDILKYVDGDFVLVDSNGNIKQTQGFANQSANVVFAGPSSGAAVPPTFRILVGADIPGTISYSRTFLVNVFNFPDPISEWKPTIYGTYLGVSLAAKKCWIPLSFLKLGDIITAYNLVGDAIETTALTLDCKLVQVNKANPLTTTDITNGAMAQVTSAGNFDVAGNPDDTTVVTDKQYLLEVQGTTGVLDEIYVIGAEVTVTRLI